MSLAAATWIENHKRIYDKMIWTQATELTDTASEGGYSHKYLPCQTSSTWVLYTHDEVLKKRVLIGLKVQGQISLQSLQDGRGVRQGQTLPENPWVGLAHLNPIRGQESEERKNEDKIA